MIAAELKVEQGSEEWLLARLGKATASRFSDILTTIRSGESAARRNYRAELASERLTDRPYERFRTKEMEYGSDTEELARVEYMLRFERQVETAGIFLHQSLEAGASPDGLISNDGLLEVKCRNLANHNDSLHTNEVPKEYFTQIQGQLWLTERQWCDYVSYADEYPPNAQLFIKRLYRDEAFIKNLEAEVIKFLHEVDAEVEFIKNYKPSLTDIKAKEPAHAITT